LITNTYAIKQNYEAVNSAFSKQALHFDEDERNNPLLSRMRGQVYRHVEQFLHVPSNILELNAGTGIDAIHFIAQGHSVCAVEIADGMIAKLSEKRKLAEDRLTIHQLNFEKLEALKTDRKFDFVFSNFGGLNCSEDISRITKRLPGLLNPGAYVTWVIMPPVCPMEILALFKGNFRFALRRFRRGGTPARVEGNHFLTYYYSVNDLKSAFGKRFQLISSESLALLTPQPHQSEFAHRNATICRLLVRADSVLRKVFPFNRWGDHIIVTFKYTG
jgi:SAM-dependent methyltransferase